MRQASSLGTLSHFSRPGALILALLAALVLAACGHNDGALPGAPQDASRASSSAWNPQAPLRKVLPLNQSLAQATVRTLGAYTLSALDAGDQPDPAALAALSLKQTAAGLELRTSRTATFVQVYLRYDASREHPVKLDCSRTDGIGLALKVEPGLLGLAVTGLNGRNFNTSQPIARLSFAPGADLDSVKTASTVNKDPLSVVGDLAGAEVTGDVTLNWSEHNTGDYNLDGQVLISDLASIGIFFQKKTDPGLNPDFAKAEVVDGNNDGVISIQDLTKIGANFRTRVDGYDVFRTTLTSADEVPLISDTGRWTKLVNAAAPNGPSAPRQFNGQQTRLVYTFLDSGLGPGDYAWYVVASGYKVSVADGQLEEATGHESNIAHVTVGTGNLPNALLTFEIQAPGSALATVGDDFYLAVKINSVTGLFSSNVRFEYDNSLVDYVEGVDAYSGHANFLTPPLFLAVDNVDTATSPYKLVGFNATQTQGTAAVDGTGVLGYFKFHCKAAGINAEAFRFPQSTNFIYLWGPTYGLATANATYGPAQNLNIAN